MDEHQTEIIDKCAEQLGEAFESVLILACTKDSGETTFVERARGNFYAARGMAYEYINGASASRIGNEVRQQDGD